MNHCSQEQMLRAASDRLLGSISPLMSSSVAVCATFHFTLLTTSTRFSLLHPLLCLFLFCAIPKKGATQSNEHFIMLLKALIKMDSASGGAGLMPTHGF